jgi:phosphohistidine phosphatase
MELILWRHAEAEEGRDDLARELTPKGRKQAAKMAAWLNTRLPEGCRILSSPAARAQQTAQALNREIETEASLAPGASVKTILNAASWPDSEGCILIAGHQPDLGEAAAYLLGANGSLAMKKAGVWWFASRAKPVGNEIVLRAVMTPDLL